MRERGVSLWPEEPNRERMHFLSREGTLPIELLIREKDLNSCFMSKRTHRWCRLLAVPAEHTEPPYQSRLDAHHVATHLISLSITRRTIEVVVQRGAATSVLPLPEQHGRHHKLLSDLEEG